MIHYLTGNLLDSEAQALVNTINTVGVMGKGIALQFKNIFPNNFKIYATACKNKEVKVGKLLITEEETLMKGKKLIINFPTKTNWQLPSEYSYIEAGLAELVKEIHEKEIKSIAIPPLGSGNGGLDWNRVKVILEKYLTVLNCEVYIYEPNTIIQEVLKKERVKLTPAEQCCCQFYMIWQEMESLFPNLQQKRLLTFCNVLGPKKHLNWIIIPIFMDRIPVK